MSKRVAAVVVLAVLALPASCLFVPVRDGLRLTDAPPGWNGETAVLHAEFVVGRDFRAKAMLASGGTWFVDRLDDMRIAAVWRRSFHRGAVRIDGVSTPALRGDFIYKRVMLAVQVLILFLSGGLLRFLVRRERRRNAPAAI